MRARAGRRAAGRSPWRDAPRVPAGDEFTGDEFIDDKQCISDTRAQITEAPAATDLMLAVIVFPAIPVLSLETAAAIYAATPACRRPTSAFRWREPWLLWDCKSALTWERSASAWRR
jgi:hypothetical protein